MYLNKIFLGIIMLNFAPWHDINTVHQLSAISYTKSQSIYTTKYEREQIAILDILNTKSLFTFNIFIGPHDASYTHAAFTLNYNNQNVYNMRENNTLTIRMKSNSFTIINNRKYNIEQSTATISHADLVLNSIFAEIGSIAHLLNSWIDNYEIQQNQISCDRNMPYISFPSTKADFLQCNNITSQSMLIFLDEIIQTLCDICLGIREKHYSNCNSPHYHLIVNILSAAYNTLTIFELYNMIYSTYCNIVQILKIHSYQEHDERYSKQLKQDTEQNHVEQQMNTEINMHIKTQIQECEQQHEYAWSDTPEKRKYYYSNTLTHASLEHLNATNHIESQYRKNIEDDL